MSDQRVPHDYGGGGICRSAPTGGSVAKNVAHGGKVAGRAGDGVPQCGRLDSWEGMKLLRVWNFVGQDLGLGSSSLQRFLKICHCFAQPVLKEKLGTAAASVSRQICIVTS